MWRHPTRPLELVEAATDNGIPILAYHPVRAYLEGCARGNRVPDPARIITTIVHGHAEMNFMFDNDLPLPRPQGPLHSAPGNHPRRPFYDD